MRADRSQDQPAVKTYMMKRTWFLFGVIPGLASACIDKDILNISDSIETVASYSLPAGFYSANINDFLVSLDTVTTPYPDSLYFNNTLLPNIADAIVFSAGSPFDFNLMPDAGEEIQSIELVVVVSNGYPTDLSAQVYFDTDDPPAVADSAFADGARTVPAATLNGEGLVVSPTEQVFTIPMPQAFVQDFTSLSQIRIAGLLETRRSGSGKVKFYSDYKVMIHVGYRIVLKINTGEL